MNRPSPRLRTALEFLLYAILTAIMLHATWLTWPDAYIDFSRELYLPWRVSCGDVLYRDLAYDFGPVSVYVNAALFAILGRPSIHALFALNFVFWVATLLALRAILRRIASPLATTLAVSSFILLFSFSRYTLVGNFNFLAPYSHEITRGFFFALLALLSLDYALAPSPRGLPANGRVGEMLHLRFFALSGFLFALVLFTKPELALATTAALALLFAFHAWRWKVVPFRPFFAFSLAVLATFVLVVTPFAAAFRSLPRAIHDTFLDLYLGCFDNDLLSLPFYRRTTGFDAPWVHAFNMLRGAFFAAAPLLLVRVLLPRIPSRPLRICTTLLISACAAAIGWYEWAHLNAALPLAPLLFFSLLFWNRRETLLAEWRQRIMGCPAAPLAAAFAVFAFLLVSKMILNASVSFYGFVLALPAFCCAIFLFFRPNPPPPPTHTFSRVLISMALLASFVAGGLYCNAVTLRNFGIRTPVFDGSFRTAGFQARAFDEALSWIRSNTPPDSTLAVLPEGAVLNVLSCRPNPAPFVYLSPGDVLRFGERTILSAYSNSPPDTLVLVAKIGEAKFGVDYAQDLMAFLDPLYTPAYVYATPSPAGPVPYLLVATRIPSTAPSP